MQKKIDLGTDLNVITADSTASAKPMMTFLMDDMPKSGDETLADARKTTWINWINSEPLLMAHTDEKGTAYLFFISEMMKNKVIVLFIWDYTLLPCKRMLSYVTEWNHRYSGAGLMTIGIHSPLFEFGKDKKNIIDAVRDFGITFPVVQDNNFNIWRSLENRYWPRLVLLDPAGRNHRDLVGEDGYVEFEKNIQVLLRELSPGLACPPVMRPLRASDREDYKIPNTTPEIFMGMRWKARLGNSTVFRKAGEEITFADDSNGTYAPDLPYLSGTWVANHEGIYAVPSAAGNKININFSATDVYIVGRSRARNPLDIAQTAKVQFQINGKPPFDDAIGPDAVSNELRRCVASIRDPRLYHVLTRLEHKSHTLTISIDEIGADTLELFGIFFEHRG